MVYTQRSPESALTSSPVYRLMYMSSAHHDMSDAELEKILATARAFNPTQGITGLLLYVERQFLQYLEGDERAVEALYKSIEKDPRHSGVMRLFSGDYDRRIFGDWSMGFERIAPVSTKQIEGAIDLCQQSVRESVPPEAPNEIAMFMESFYRNSMGLRGHG